MPSVRENVTSSVVISMEREIVKQGGPPVVSEENSQCGKWLCEGKKSTLLEKMCMNKCVHE